MKREQYITMIESVRMSDTLRDTLISAYEPCFEGIFSKAILPFALAAGIGLGATNAEAKPLSNKSGKAQTTMVKQQPKVVKTVSSGRVSNLTHQAYVNRNDAITKLTIQLLETGKSRSFDIAQSRATQMVDSYVVQHFSNKRMRNEEKYKHALAAVNNGEIK